MNFLKNRAYNNIIYHLVQLKKKRADQGFDKSFPSPKNNWLICLALLSHIYIFIFFNKKSNHILRSSTKYSKKEMHCNDVKQVLFQFHESKYCSKTNIMLYFTFLLLAVSSASLETLPSIQFLTLSATSIMFARVIVSTLRLGCFQPAGILP